MEGELQRKGFTEAEEEMLHTSIFSTKDLFSWLQQNAERDCIQVGPGVQIHQHKHSSQPPISYALPIHVGYWSLLLLHFTHPFFTRLWEIPCS